MSIEHLSDCVVIREHRIVKYKLCTAMNKCVCPFEVSLWVLILISFSFSFAIMTVAVDLSLRVRLELLINRISTYFEYPLEITLIEIRTPD